MKTHFRIDDGPPRRSLAPFSNGLRGALDLVQAARRSYADGGVRAVTQLGARRRGRAVTDVQDDISHIRRAADWLCLAQDCSPAGGVNWGYHLLHGWRAAYPETTGYIIPTFFDLAEQFEQPAFAERAVRMAHWECDEQMADGAVMAGTVDVLPRRPALFNTGQVLFGWTRAFQETADERFADAALRAGQWMCSLQDGDGAWRQGLSPQAFHQGPRSYNVRAAWGLLQAGQVLQRDDFVEAARRAAQWTLTQQAENGWFENCCLSNAEQPLTHTLAYTCRGLLEIGAALQQRQFTEAAEAAAWPLARAVREDGFLAGRFDRKWRAAANWSCLTGQCQMAIVWLKLWRQGAHGELRDAARKCLDYVKGRQSNQRKNQNVHGAIPGSCPITGDYARLRFPNWAAKFFIDALLLIHRMENHPRRQLRVTNHFLGQKAGGATVD